MTLCRRNILCTYNEEVYNNEVYNTYRIMYMYSVLFIDFYLMPPHL